MKAAGPKIMLLVLKRNLSPPLPRMLLCAASRSKSVSIHGPIGLKVSVFLARHMVRSPDCQVRSLMSLPIVQPSTHDSAAFSERCLAFVLHALSRIGRDHDRLPIRDQRIVGAIADVRRLGQFRLLAALFGRLDDVLGVIEPRAIESARLDRHQQLDRRQWPECRRLLIAGKRVAAHVGYHVAFDDPINRLPLGLVAYPAHSLPPSQTGTSPFSIRR